MSGETTVDGHDEEHLPASTEDLDNRGPLLAMARRLSPLLFTIATMLALELGRLALGVSSEATIPSLWSVIGDFVGLLVEADFWQAMVQSLVPWLIALGLALAIGIPVGFAIGSSPWFRGALSTPVEILRPIPSVALIPLTVVWLGATGWSAKIFLATFASVWPVVYQARYGAGQIDSTLAQTARSYGLGPVARVRHVVLPSMAPFVATGIRLAAAIALILVISSELLIGGDGIGVAINDARQALDLPRMYALTAASGLLGWLVAYGLKRLEARALFWHSSQRLAEV